jgi:hypothetical protein
VVLNNAICVSPTYTSHLSLPLVSNETIYPSETKSVKLSSSTRSAYWHELMLFANISFVTLLKLLTLECLMQIALYDAGSVNYIPNTIIKSGDIDKKLSP